MKNVNSSNDTKISLLIPVMAIIGGYIWQALIRTIVITYLSRELGNRQLAVKTMNELLQINLTFQFVAYVGMEIIMVLIVYFLIKKYHYGKFSLDFIGMNLKKESFKHLTVGFGIGLIMQITLYIIAIVLGSYKFVGSDFANYPIYEVIISIIIAFVMTAFAGFCEEIVFRGVMLKYLMKSKGKVSALIISSIAFSFLHVGRGGDNIMFFIFAIVAGIVFGCLYIITDSLYLSIGLHFAYDFYGILIKCGDGSLFNLKSVFIFDIIKDFDTVLGTVECIEYLLVLIILFIIYKRKKINLLGIVMSCIR